MRGEIFSRPVLVPTKPLVQMVPVSFADVKRSRRGNDHPPPLAPTLKNEYSYASTPALGLHGLFWGKARHYMEVASFKFRSLYPGGKSPQCPPNKKLGESQTRDGRYRAVGPNLISLAYPLAVCFHKLYHSY